MQREKAVSSQTTISDAHESAENEKRTTFTASKMADKITHIFEVSKCIINTIHIADFGVPVSNCLQIVRIRYQVHALLSATISSYLIFAGSPFNPIRLQGRAL
jgi:hypothetical protein